MDDRPKRRRKIEPRPDAPYLERLAWWKNLDGHEQRIEELRQEQQEVLQRSFDRLQASLDEHLDEVSEEKRRELEARVTARVDAFARAIEQYRRQLDLSDRELEQLADRLADRPSPRARSTRHATSTPPVASGTLKRIERLERDRRWAFGWAGVLTLVLAGWISYSLWPGLGGLLPDTSDAGDAAGAPATADATVAGSLRGDLADAAFRGRALRRVLDEVFSPCLAGRAVDCRVGLARGIAATPTVAEAFRDRVQAASLITRTRVENVLVQSSLVVRHGEPLIVDGDTGPNTTAALSRHGLTRTDVLSPELVVGDRLQATAAAALLTDLQLGHPAAWSDAPSVRGLGLSQVWQPATEPALGRASTVDQAVAIVASHLLTRDELLAADQIEGLPAADRARLETAYDALRARLGVGTAGGSP